MIVRFNFVNKQGRFRGLRRLNLEYFDDTDAPIRDRLGMWVMREAGLDAPRANHARVFKDGAYAGPLHEHRGASTRSSWRTTTAPPPATATCGRAAASSRPTRTCPTQPRLEALNALIEREPLDGDHTAFYAQLDAMADIDEIMLELAAETAALTDDNFSNGAENFFYYDHPTARLPGVALGPRHHLLGRHRLRRVRLLGAGAQQAAPAHQPEPHLAARYVDKLVDIRDRVLTRMAAKAKAICDQVAPYVAVDPNRRPSYGDFLEECAFFQEVIPQRIADIRKQLGALRRRPGSPPHGSARMKTLSWGARAWQARRSCRRPSRRSGARWPAPRPASTSTRWRCPRLGATLIPTAKPLGRSSAP